MRQAITVKIILMCAGAVGLAVGFGMLFFPIWFHASSGIELGPGAELLNELRAAGGAVFAAGAVIFAGAFVPWLRFPATLLASILYLSYGLGRLVSLFLDGYPNTALLQIAGFEIVVGLVCAAALVATRRSTFSKA